MIDNKVVFAMNVVAELERHEKKVLKNESQEDLEAAQTAVQRDPKAQKWLESHRKIWQE